MASAATWMVKNGSWLTTMVDTLLTLEDNWSGWWREGRAAKHAQAAAADLEMGAITLAAALVHAPATTPADAAAKTAANAATTNVVRATAAETASKVAADVAATLIAATGAPGGNSTMAPASAATAVALAAAPPPSPVVPPVVPPRCPSRCLLVVGRNDSEFPRWVAVTPLWVVIEDVERVIGKEIEFCVTAGPDYGKAAFPNQNRAQPGSCFKRSLVFHY